jgi:ABC-type transport system involved in cytochrome c biogenesis permease subunit
MEPFYNAMVIYVLAGLLACFFWFNLAEVFRRSAVWLLYLAFAIHTIGLVYRMVLEGRPPVTNLYSSAIFIGWGACLLGLILERFHRNGIGAVVAAGIGFITLIIAHHLALDGDTMEMMRAVLDTNFWLATHVVAVTVGYASTFVAGFLALIYILRGMFTRTLDEATSKSLCRMIYGIVCFATLFSFVGTVLGGIWADQSWGRFWGWDPKENGALIIVLWNALILHLRWGGLIRERGLVNCAIFGNLVMVRREHARHRAAQLRFYRGGLQVAGALRGQPACLHRPRLFAVANVEKFQSSVGTHPALEPETQSGALSPPHPKETFNAEHLTPNSERRRSRGGPWALNVER